MSTEANLKALLKWSLKQQNDGTTASERKPFDPEWMNALLGPDDASLIVSSMQTLIDNSAPIEAREEAVDDLIYLTETIDNAANLHCLGALQPLVAMLSMSTCSDSNELPPAAVRAGVCWILATAMLNNTKTQKHFLEVGGPTALLELLRMESDSSVRLKALSATSAFLGHFPEGQQSFAHLGGFDILSAFLGNRAVETSTAAVPVETDEQWRVIFMLNKLISDESTCSAWLLDHIRTLIPSICRCVFTDEKMIKASSSLSIECFKLILILLEKDHIKSEETSDGNSKVIAKGSTTRNILKSLDFGVQLDSLESHVGHLVPSVHGKCNAADDGTDCTTDAWELHALINKLQTVILK